MPTVRSSTFLGDGWSGPMRKITYLRLSIYVVIDISDNNSGYLGRLVECFMARLSRRTTVSHLFQRRTWCFLWVLLKRFPSFPCCPALLYPGHANVHVPIMTNDTDEVQSVFLVTAHPKFADEERHSASPPSRFRSVWCSKTWTRGPCYPPPRAIWIIRHFEIWSINSNDNDKADHLPQ